MTGRESPGSGRYALPESHSRAVADVLVELREALDKFAPFNSSHEGKAVIEEELDELWQEIKANKGRGQNARNEAIQIAAMALRYAADLTDELAGKRCPQYAPHAEHEYGCWWCPGVKVTQPAPHERRAMGASE